LQQLADVGEAGRTITGLRPRGGLLRLVQLKYVTEQSTSPDTVLYRINDADRDALRVLRWGGSPKPPRATLIDDLVGASEQRDRHVRDAERLRRRRLHRNCSRGFETLLIGAPF
jgi:hypothetical protein